ncbi:hypothetical protein GCM10010274_29860 [Streptomyces lavendofoliae]|uniref:Uncharacterized protein n=1 Tax=Streptomyces lavendofoliae TaxID=67314 RepID=A0A918HX57_9ACTN|nr:hypothetical protein GCM10010274_29860 [Streptomyces lavendofoliae]
MTVGAAILPLTDFFARGGHRTGAGAGPVEEAAPAWRATLRDRAAQ